MIEAFLMFSQFAYLINFFYKNVTFEIYDEKYLGKIHVSIIFNIFENGEFKSNRRTRHASSKMDEVALTG